jgi:uroporphyrinogen-III decarboxylase
VERGQSAVSGRERVVAAYKGGYADCVPAYPIAGSFAGCLDGLSIEEYCTDPTKAVRAMLNYYERYQPDIMVAFNDLAKEAEAVGCRVKYSDYVVPSIDKHVLQDDKGLLARMEIPDPCWSGRGRSRCSCAIPRSCAWTRSTTRRSSTT